jgi:peroxiredoxin
MTPRRCARVLLAALWLLAGACGGSQAEPTTPEAESAPVELTLIAADGERFGLAALRGRPVLLFVFTTYDQASQLALTPLIAFLGAHRELQTLGIAAQPDPEALLPLYRDALGVPFPLVYEAEPQIVAGKSMLGPIETVPTYVLLDAAGRITARHTGALADDELEAFAESVLE